MTTSSAKKKILIICFTDTRFDARVARQLDFLKDEYEVTFVGHGIHLDSGIEFVKIPKPPLETIDKAVLAGLLLSRNYSDAYWCQYPYRYLNEKLKPARFDLVLANDVESLPLAFYLAKDNGIKILYDAHEYAPRQFEDRLYWRIFFQKYTMHLCRKYIPKVNGMFTVCDGLAKEYQKEFSVFPEIFTNAPAHHDLKPSQTFPDKIRLIHHGIVNMSRKLENMIEMTESLDDRFTLDIMVKTTPSSSNKTLAYFERLKKMARESEKVRFIPPVPSAEVVSSINKYDMGIFILEPINFNYTYALPNKLFDFVQARLGIAISPSVEMKKVVQKYDLGTIGDDFSAVSLGKKLNALSQEDVIRFKENSHKAAEKLSATENRRLLIRTIESILEKK